MKTTNNAAGDRSIGRILLAGLLGAIAVYMWGGISWTLLPLHGASLSTVPNDSAVVRSLHGQKSGIYTFPAMPEDEAFNRLSDDEQHRWGERYEAGPSGLIVYFEHSGNPWSPTPFIGGLALYLASSVIAAWLVAQTLPSRPSYAKRVLVVAVVGLFSALVSHMAQWNWGFLTGGYALVQSLDLVVGWALAGMVIAWRVRGEEGE